MLHVSRREGNKFIVTFLPLWILLVDKAVDNVVDSELVSLHQVRGKR